MDKSTSWILGGTVAAVAVSLLLVAPGEHKMFWKDAGITLGLDLQGGAELLFAPDYAGIEDPVERERVQRDPKHLATVVSVVSRRIDIHGLKEMSIRQTEGGRIRVVLPGSGQEETTRVRKLIEQAGRLEFRIVAPDDLKARYPYPATPEGYKWLPMRERADGGGDTRDMVKIPDSYEFKGSHLEKAEVGTERFGENVVRFSIQRRYVEIFERLTGENVNRPMAIVLDGKIVTAPNIKSKISDQGYIEGGKGGAGFSLAYAQDLATVLKSGSLPVALRIESENIVGPGLGEDSIHAGLVASAICAAGIVLVMCVYYLWAGFVASLGLAVVTCLILGAMAALNATLSLPGIAGLVLTVAMAVDSNILIYERIREERRAGLGLLEAVRAGFDRATETILDSNITTLLTAVILYLIGEGPVQGFAITLSIGIVATMLVALVPTRALFLWMVQRGVVREIKMRDVVGMPRVAFTNALGPCLAVSGLAVVGGLALFWQRGGDNLGLDFRSGVLAQVATKGEVTIDEVRKAVTGLTAPDGAGGTFRPYESAEIQSVTRAGAAGRLEYQVRTGILDQDAVRNDLATLFAGRLAPPGMGEAERLPGAVRVEVAYAVRGEERLAGLVKAVQRACDGLAEEEKLAQRTPDELTAGPASEDQGREKVARVVVRMAERPYRAGETRADLEGRLQRLAERVRVQLTDDTYVPADPLVASQLVEDAGTLRFPVHFRDPVVFADVEAAAVDAMLADFRVERGPGEPAEGAVRSAMAVLGKVKAGEEDRVETARTTLREKLRARGLILSDPFPLMTKISPIVAGEMRQKGTLAMLLSMLVMVGYMAVRFKGAGAGGADVVEGFGGLFRDLVYRARYGISAVAALAHNVIVTLGIVAAVDHFGLLTAKVDLAMVAAFLTIIGYGINDTIVVFDRIRENLRATPEAPLRGLIDLSVSQTLGRTLLTGGTTIFSTAVLVALGAESTRGFCFAMCVGVIIGTYSSIYIAAPLLLLWEKKAPAPGGAPATAPVAAK